MKPAFEKLEPVAPHVTLVKVDVDDCEEVASQCEIDCMPTFRFHIGNNLEPALPKIFFTTFTSGINKGVMKAIKLNNFKEFILLVIGLKRYFH